MSGALPQAYLVLHGETAWSLSGQATGRTDLPLTEQGGHEARGLSAQLKGVSFAQMLTSPLQRARRTAEPAGFGECTQVDADLAATGKGVFAADNSTGTIEKRFKAVSVACTEQTRRDYRELLFSTPGLGAVQGVL